LGARRGFERNRFEFDLRVSFLCSRLLKSSRRSFLPPPARRTCACWRRCQRSAPTSTPSRSVRPDRRVESRRPRGDQSRDAGGTTITPPNSTKARRKHKGKRKRPGSGRPMLRHRENCLGNVAHGHAAAHGAGGLAKTRVGSPGNAKLSAPGAGPGGKNGGPCFRMGLVGRLRARVRGLMLTDFLLFFPVSSFRPSTNFPAARAAPEIFCEWVWTPVGRSRK